MNKLENLKAKFEADVEKMKKTEKDREKTIGIRQQLEGQLTENNLVKAEFDLLEDDANVFKLIGPVLVKQDLTEARQNVQKRLDYIGTEIKRVENMISDHDKQIKEQTEALTKSQAVLKQQLAIHHAQAK
uniref:Probable prefoldin subunit 6 n=1 Tax=Steinernema glaseri TaxID=37863 RepID=A0A1I7YWS1_9BILA